ncbi:type I-E CRISPR-associated protein Cse2/CasB [Streptomyces sp. NRRL S-474]|uniref:type I-E CRISPR-associated protein Cse2/CasB n=1 Tax=Streptomyces sp. NRRL S-474 TaxID=1463909 RepID=UPI000A641D6E|nr:type I-E CRISPR-associated protein Cse2/CasB [Streptomyces sp. NRRL S-474]
MTDSAPAAPAPPTSSSARTSDRFVTYVHGMCASTQARAALRRGLGLPVERCNYLHRYLVPWLRDHDDQHHGEVRRAYYAVASLIAARPRSARDSTPDPSASVSWYERPNLGASLGQAVAQGVMKANSAESALHLMARQSSDAIHPSLPALVRQLQSGGIAVDWAVLLEDLAWWNRSRDRIATRWLESYFRTAAGTTDPTPSDSLEENNR